MQLLLVEDDPSIREVVAEILEGDGFTVAEAANAEIALAALSESPADSASDPGVEGPSILVTDVELGSTMDGVELAFELRRRWPLLLIVVMSGAPHQLPRCAALEPNTRQLLKPFPPQALLDAVHSLGAGPNAGS